MLCYIERAAAKFDLPINALVLMANHFHLIVVPPTKDALAGFMKSFQQKYAGYRNGKRAGSGKLFEERYQSKPIRSEGQLGYTTAYVELNPVRAGVVKQPDEYRWSTFRLHAREGKELWIPPRLLTPSRWYSGLSRDPIRRLQLYAEFVEDCRRREVKPDDIRPIATREREAQEPFTTRLERPNRRRASEQMPVYAANQGRRTNTLRGSGRKSRYIKLF